MDICIMRPRIYVDTSVSGGCEDVEFIGHSRRAAVRAHLEGVPESLVEVLALDSEAEELAAQYINDGAVGKNERADALHIALATAARVDVLVSWNFKHIVNLRRIHAFNAVNLKYGYPVLEIRNPREVIGDE